MNSTEPARIFLAPTMDGSPPILPFMAKAPEYFDFSGFIIAGNVAEADFVALPYTPRHLSEEFKAYVQKTIQWAESVGKKTIAFIAGDYAYKLHIPGAIVFKASAFRHGLQPEEIVSVSFTDDPYHDKEFAPHGKSTKPIVGFCGFAEMTSPLTWGKYVITNTALDVAALATGKPHLTAHKRGIYFRRKAMHLLEKDPRIETRFILRPTFFGQAPKEETDRQRQEYLENMAHSDFALAPRGDGNYSRRFFRALSMGAIPILIDSDMMLPLERHLDYSRFIVRIPHTKIDALPERIVSLYNSLTEEEFKNMQRDARNAFLEYLRQDRFYARAFSLLKAQGPETL